jgi:hypothetical protein
VKAHRVRAQNLNPESDNKIHDDEVARRFGFTGALVPGVEVFAYATYPFAQAWGEEFLSRGLIDVRFSKPVYDGEDVDVRTEKLDDGRYEVNVVGPDAVVRASGHASLAESVSLPDPNRFSATAQPAVPPVADERSLAAGTQFGTVVEAAMPDAHELYRNGVSDDLPLYERFVHPGALLRVVNAVLHRNVRMGPWIHTSSAVRLLAPARVPSTLVGRGVVTDRYDKNGRSWVRFDALVLADDEPVIAVDHLAIYDLGDPGR